MPDRTPPADQRGRLRRSLEDGDRIGVLDEILNRSERTSDKCWVWKGRTNGGYPIVKIAKRSVAVHRLALEAYLGEKLGSQAAHHICANSMCVNPLHLQPVTHRENVAEMLARNAYLARIRELEEALREACPGHPLLHLVQVA